MLAEGFLTTLALLFFFSQGGLGFRAEGVGFTLSGSGFKVLGSALPKDLGRAKSFKKNGGPANALLLKNDMT